MGALDFQASEKKSINARAGGTNSVSRTWFSAAFFMVGDLQRSEEDRYDGNMASTGARKRDGPTHLCNTSVIGEDACICDSVAFDAANSSSLMLQSFAKIPL